MGLRSQISLEPELGRRARRRAAERKISLDEYVRELVARDLGPKRERGPAATPGTQGAVDVSREPGAIQGVAVEAERRRDL